MILHSLTENLMPRYLVGGLLLVSLLSCDDGMGSEDMCNAMSFPIMGTVEGPVVTNVTIELVGSSAVVRATATDPQDSPNLAGVSQTIGVFQDRLCTTEPITIADEVESGVQQTFGIVATTSDNPPLYTAIAGSLSWPVEVDFTDADGNRTTGRARATIPR
jgi:hypothetical protein